MAEGNSEADCESFGIENCGLTPGCPGTDEMKTACGDTTGEKIGQCLVCVLRHFPACGAGDSEVCL
jgi:hypothetical protein